MTLAKLSYGVLLFALGLVVGALWNAQGRSSSVPRHGVVDSAARADGDECLSKVGETLGEGTARFVKQFEEMNTHIKQYPIDAWSSMDGRFVIRLFGKNETIASDLHHPDDVGPVKQLVRHYSFSCAGRSYSCDFGRSIVDAKTTEVQFHFSDDKGGELTYADSDGDGQWDRFIDHTHKPPVFYDRDGLCWKQSTKEKRGSKQTP